MMDVKFFAKNKVRKELIMPTVSQVMTTTTMIMMMMTTTTTMMMMMMYEQTKFSHGGLRGGSRGER